MKILSIGNSFSQDAHKYLHKIAVASGFDIETVNLYIGGCSLKRHYDNMISGAADYDLERNGGPSERKISLNEAITLDDWDVVTLQQASHFSGMPQSYVPYITELASFIRKYAPKSKIYFHQTWAYEHDSVHSGFATYNQSQEEMFRRLRDASEMAAKLIDAEIIPTGTVIQKLRESLPEFDYRNGGKSLCRDGFHLSLDYGRFTAAAVWFNILTKGEIKLKAFENLSHPLLENIVATILDTT
ncbi:MAG: DUF4886 domain-containing protein [Clostridia bacterium]|nr:DUF4886 domain-containing protein [Clostridia bacterium]